MTKTQNGRNRTLSSADIEMIANIIDGSLDEKLTPIHNDIHAMLGAFKIVAERLNAIESRLDSVQHGLRIAGGVDA